MFFKLYNFIITKKNIDEKNKIYFLFENILKFRIVTGVKF